MFRDVKLMGVVWCMLLAPLILGCTDKEEVWKGGIETLPLDGRACALSWVTNLQLANNVEVEIRKLGFEPDKILVLKSAISDRGVYYFVGLFHADGNSVAILASAKSIVPLVITGDESINEIIYEAASLVNDDGGVIKGDVSGSHVSFNFLYYKNQGEERRYAMIGRQEEGKTQKLVNLIKDRMPPSKIDRVDDEIKAGTAAEIEKFNDKVMGSVFFELRSLIKKKER